jgi:hypothetical protein
VGAFKAYHLSYSTIKLMDFSSGWQALRKNPVRVATYPLNAIASPLLSACALIFSTGRANGNSSSIRLLGQVGSFFSVSLSHAARSNPLTHLHRFFARSRRFYPPGRQKYINPFKIKGSIFNIIM